MAGGDRPPPAVPAPLVARLASLAGEALQARRPPLERHLQTVKQRVLAHLGEEHEAVTRSDLAVARCAELWFALVLSARDGCLELRNTKR
jgi:hypothetical protein